MTESGIQVNQPRDFTAIISEKEQPAPGIWSMTFVPEGHAANPSPGQFFMVKAWKTHDPFLSRPLAASGLHPDGSVEILFKVCGKGTTLLSGCRKGDSLFLRGPCGKGFPKPGGKRILLAAGAMGVAPLLLAGERYHDTSDILLLVGLSGDRESQSFSRALLERYPQIMFFSENGAFGEKGTVVDGIVSLARSETIPH